MSDTKVSDTESPEKKDTASNYTYVPMHNNPYPDEFLNDSDVWKRIRIVKSKKSCGYTLGRE